ncbi:MAG: hypothetical protein RL385_3913 [Pseudomonadota bacterium]|jgi:hypothetical protein
MKRRDILKLAATSAAALTTGTARPFAASRARAQEALDPREKFLFVVTANGGGSMLDSFYPVIGAELKNGKSDVLTTYPESLVAQPKGSTIRCVKRMENTGIFTSAYSLETLVEKHFADMVIVPVDNTSVNHVVAQKRAITGSGVDRGRTIMEAVAERHGAKKLIANCNMAAGGYIAPGDDPSMPDWARGELISSPALFPLATDSARGVAGAPGRELLQRAREVRRELEATSAFAARYAESPLRRRFVELQGKLSSGLMDANLISKLMVVPDADGSSLSGALPLTPFDLESSPDGRKVWSAFPEVMTDSLHAQGALAFLLARYGVSSVVSLGPSSRPVFLDDGRILGTPISFDYSHVDHQSCQNIMWSRMGMLLDGLITLLKGEPLGEGTMWDRSLIYVATDFGRGRDRPSGASQWGSVHELNNANLFISPMLKGNRMFGGIDLETLRFHGFDRKTGEADPGVMLREADLYSLVAHAFDVEFEGRTDMRALLR